MADTTILGAGDHMIPEAATTGIPEVTIAEADTITDADAIDVTAETAGTQGERTMDRYHHRQSHH